MSNPSRVSAAAITLIKSHEGVRSRAYRCPANVLTIGVGHTGPDVKEGAVWTDVQIDAALKADLIRFERGVVRLIGTAKTSQAQFDAMVSLAFNIGLGNFTKSSVLANHLNGRHQSATAAFHLWNKGGGRVLPGLVTRRASEARLYASG